MEKGSSMIGTYKSIVSGLRIYGFPLAIKNKAFNLDLETLNWEVDKGIINETIRFKFRGERDNLITLHNYIKELVG